MTTAATDVDPLLRRARELLAANDDLSARPLLEAMIAEPPSPTWAGAHAELAFVAWKGGHYDDVVAHAHVVLAEPSIDGVERAVAAHWAVLGADAMDTAVDRALLDEAIAGLDAAEPSMAASVRSLRARLAHEGGDVAAARADWEAAIPRYERAGSMLGGPNAHRRLAELDRAADDVAGARAHLDAGLAWLAQFRYGGFQVRELERRLQAMRASLGDEPPP